MIRISTLLWTLLLSLLTSGLSYFYINSSGSHGFPFRFAQEATQSAAADLKSGQAFEKVDFNYWVFALDIFFWWLLFSILLVIIKNYLFDTD
jgi:hypothetical protein